MGGETCEGCRFWFVPPDIWDEGEEPKWGHCRRYPQPIGSQCETATDYWCGEHQPKRTPLPVVESKHALNDSQLSVLALLVKHPGLKRIDFKRHSVKVEQHVVITLERRGIIRREQRKLGHGTESPRWFVTALGSGLLSRYDLKANGAP